MFECYFKSISHDVQFKKFYILPPPHTKYWKISKWIPASKLQPYQHFEFQWYNLFILCDARIPIKLQKSATVIYFSQNVFIANN